MKAYGLGSLLMGLLLMLGGRLEGGVPVKTLPSYSRNPLTGANTVSGGYYNPNTGRGANYTQSSNAMTGRTRSSANSYNTFTGNTTHRGATQNPLTGVTTRTTTRRR